MITKADQQFFIVFSYLQTVTKTEKTLQHVADHSHCPLLMCCLWGFKKDVIHSAWSHGSTDKRSITWHDRNAGDGEEVTDESINNHT